MKKTGFIWFILIIGILNLILDISSFFAPGASVSLFSTSNEIIDTAFAIISIVIWATYLYKLFVMRGDLIKWTNITFCFDIVSILVTILLYGTSLILFYMATAIVWIILWTLMYKHLKKLILKSSSNTSTS